MINLGNITIKDLRLGTTQIKDVYLGNVQIWGSEEPGPAGDWLCFTAQQQNSTVQLDKVGTSIPTVSLEYSFDKNTWTDYSWSGNTGDTLTLANVGDKVYMRAKTQNNAFARNQNARHNFVMTGLIAASGNIQTLLKADSSRTDVPAYAFPCLFQTCTSLTQAPTLPATTLADYCYYNMFANCNALTAAPQLPATTLATSCYSGMFQNTRFTSAPVLPATTLAQSCYNNMFYNCSSLTVAPCLPATTLTNQCYQGMFRNCTSLSSIEVAFTEWTNGTTSNWVTNVKSTGTFTCPATLPDTRGAGNIPEGWTKADAA